MSQDNAPDSITPYREFTQQDKQDITDLIATVYGNPRATPRKIGLEARVDDLTTDVDDLATDVANLKTSAFKKIWRYASNNPLITTAVGAVIGAVTGAVTVWRLTFPPN